MYDMHRKYMYGAMLFLVNNLHVLICTVFKCLISIFKFADPFKAATKEVSKLINNLGKFISTNKFTINNCGLYFVIFKSKK